MARNFKGKTFTKILRGYAPEEVEGYIAYIDEEYKKLERTSGDNTRKLALALRKLDEMNNYAEDLENQLDGQARQYEAEIAKQKQQIIVLAKHLQKRDSDAQSAEAAEKAKKEAETIVADAQLKAEKIVAEAEELARTMKEKILTEASARAEQIIMDAEESVKGNQNVAEDMSVAATDIYNEICAFRDTLFAAYNTHIESIEEITAAAEVLIADTDAAVNAEAANVEDFSEDTPVDEDVEISDEELLAALEIEKLEALGILETDENGEDEEILAAFDTLVADEAEFKVVEDDFSDFKEIKEDTDDGIVIDDNGFIILADAEEETEEAISTLDEVYEPTDLPGEDEIPFEIDAAEEDFEMDEETNEVEPVDATYESYETYGEIDEDELDDTIDNLAQKYSEAYTDSLDEDEDFEYAVEGEPEEAEEVQSEDYDLTSEDFESEDDGSYAPNDEFAWGDDMYAETEEFADEGEDFEDVFSIDSAADEEKFEDEMDELDKLKQFFSADYDDDSMQNKSYDTASNSTTSIALSLNDFFEEGEEQYEDDFEFDADGDMEALFEKDDDPLSVTDEFNIIFGNTDSARNVAEISRQPIIPAEEPKNPKKHRKF